MKRKQIKQITLHSARWLRAGFLYSKYEVISVMLAILALLVSLIGMIVKLIIALIDAKK